MKAQLLLADQQLLFRQGLVQALVEAGWSEITQVGNQHTLDQAFLETAIDIVVIDRQLPEIDITHYCRILMNKQPRVRILVLTAYESEVPDLQLPLLLAGAAGCLSKEHPAATYLAAIQVLMQGQVIYQYATIQQALHQAETQVYPPKTAISPPIELQPRLIDLTPRELEILHLVAEGKGNPEIAQILNITDNTVMKHVSHIISKLNVRNRMEAGLVYLRSI